uniref:uncharacterized protein LOC122587654 n=1 Tax=Erigeron canadensis TaxID=72917 RepID=UPI001CB97165|nr:uncharacterized protein LOC122587654 [Erigeron canadensis]
MLHILDFGDKWISWIKACLSSARASVLINGNLSEEFSILRGLQQGDPMEPFLFIIAMEGLHIAIDNLVKNGGFESAKIRHMRLSDLFYADDVMVGGECSIGCKVESLPFKYLGIPIGASPKRVSTWEPIISKFRKRLTRWKANLMSIGGRSTLVSSVLGSIGNYFLSIFHMPKTIRNKLEALRSSFFWGGSNNKRKIHRVKWDSVLTSKESGGIGIGSLQTMNFALLYKWRWRGLKESDILFRVISDIHGGDCFYNMSAKSKGTWKNIMLVANQIHHKAILPRDVISRKVGNRKLTRFWIDTWCGNQHLASRFKRLFAIDTVKDCLIYERHLDTSWTWKWRCDLRDGHEKEQLTNLLNILPSTFTHEDDT